MADFMSQLGDAYAQDGGAKPSSSSDFLSQLGAAQAADASSEADGHATMGSAVEYGLVNAIPFGKDIGAAVGAAESYLPSGLQAHGDVASDIASQDTFGQRVAKNRQMIKAQDAANHREYPITSAVTPIAASIATLPVAGPVEAVSSGIASVAPRLTGLAADALASGTVGAGYGAIYGAGEGDSLDERVANAKSGALLGGIGGAAAPALASGMVNGAKAGSNLVRGFVNPEAAGAKSVLETIAADRASGNGVLLSDADLAAAQQAGQPLVAADLGGNATRRLARTVANKSPDAQAALTDPTAARFATQNTRLPDFVSSMYGGNVDVQAAQDALRQQAKAINAPAYRQAYADGANGVWNADLANLVRAPDMQSAILDATRKAGNDAVLNKTTMVKNPFVSDGAGGIRLATDAQGNQAVPTLQFWDQVKRGLDDRINVAKRAGNNEDARDFMGLKSELVGHLDQAVPSYPAARQGAFQMFGADNALDAGRNVLQTASTPAQLQASVAKMTPLQRDVLSYGAASALTEKALNSGDQRSIVNLFNTPAIRDKLQVAMGPQRADQIEAYLRAEGAMTVLKNRLMGNSSTTEQAGDLLGMAAKSLTGPAAGAALGAAEGYREHGFDATEMAKYGALGFLAGTMKKFVAARSEKMVEGMANALASEDTPAYAAAVKRIAANKTAMNALRAISNSVTGASAQAGALVAQ